MSDLSGPPDASNSPILLVYGAYDVCVYGGIFTSYQALLVHVEGTTRPKTRHSSSRQNKTPHRNLMWGKQLHSRGGRIRTGDLLLPKQARYRATLRPEGMKLVGEVVLRHRYSSLSLRARSNSRNALPRWPIRSLASSEASPKVSPRSWLMKWLS